MNHVCVSFTPARSLTSLSGTSPCKGQTTPRTREACIMALFAFLATTPLPRRTSSSSPAAVDLKWARRSAPPSAASTRSCGNRRTTSSSSSWRCGFLWRRTRSLAWGSLRRRYVTPEEKRRLAKESHHFSCAVCGMSSAWEVWKTQMEQHPPMSPEVGANLPRVTDQPQSNVEAPVVAAGEAEVAMTAPAALPDGPAATASATAAASTVLMAPATAGVTETVVEKHAGNSHVDQGAVAEAATAAQVTAARAESRVGSEAVVETGTKREEASAPAMKCRAPTTETKTTTQTKEEPQPHPQRCDEYGGVHATRHGLSSQLSEAPGQHRAGEEASPVGVPPSPVFSVFTL
ncbi:hypothetical protein TRSC58_04480 [Trypanosoma rangeli SC58]|uniref:Uncharacterized protein n=1 Tax=Trypanosoma rangeli SC58 TaxID=429131 RepID=A0A061J3E1_TRYRA|nr:hypothetical protein TRSC58_04480 [Trypanosoma rangeli SC58]